MDNNIIILIDGDNINPKWCENMFEIANEKGIIVQSRLYGDFSRKEMEKWKDKCNIYGIEPIHVWPIAGKNSTDIRITADGIEILLDRNSIDTFVVVSGDSDFMTLIMKLKNKGKKIIGMSGYSQSTSKSLQNYCDEFFIFNDDKKEEDNSTSLINTIKLVFEKENKKSIDLSELKTILLRINPVFNERNYGYSSFSKFINSLDICELTWHETKVMVTFINNK